MCDRVPNQFLSIPNRTDFKLFKVTDVERQNMKELKKQNKQKRNLLQIPCTLPTPEHEKYGRSYPNLIFKKYICIFLSIPYFLCDFVTRC